MSLQLPMPYEMVVFCRVPRDNAESLVAHSKGRDWRSVLPPSYKCTDGNVLSDPADGPEANIRLLFHFVEQTDERGNPVTG